MNSIGLMNSLGRSSFMLLAGLRAVIIVFNLRETHSEWCRSCTRVQRDAAVALVLRETPQLRSRLERRCSCASVERDTAGALSLLFELVTHHSCKNWLAVPMLIDISGGMGVGTDRIIQCNARPAQRKCVHWSLSTEWVTYFYHLPLYTDLSSPWILTRGAQHQHWHSLSSPLALSLLQISGFWDGK